MSFLKPHLDPAAPSPPPAPAPAAVIDADAARGPFRFTAPDPQVRTALDALDAIAESRARAERLFTTEMQRMEDTFIVHLKQLEDRLAQAQADLAEVQRKYDALLKAQLENERHMHTLKELKRLLQSV